MSQVQDKVAGAEIDERWLPPSPHREKLLEKIALGRAHIEETGHNQPPLVYFEDGGMMELPRVRWAGANQFRARYVGRRRRAPDPLHRRLRQH